MDSLTHSHYTLYIMQGYWALAAARHNRIDVFEREFRNLVWLSQEGHTFAEFYELDGAFPQERRRQLWSDTGFLSMVYHGLFGMQFQPNGIAFRPVKPASLFGNKPICLRGVHYRDAILNIRVEGSGSQVAACSIDGNKSSKQAFIDGNLEGTHEIVITLSNGGNLEQQNAAAAVPLDMPNADALHRHTMVETNGRSKRWWVVYAGLGLAVLAVFAKIKDPLKRSFRKKCGDSHNK